MESVVVVFLAVFAYGACDLQELAGQSKGILQFAKIAKDVLIPMLKDSQDETKDWNLFDIPCNYHREGGFHKFEWKYDGKISCPGLGEYHKSGCKSKGCAFKEPMKQYLAKLIEQGKATKGQLVEHINNCGDCNFNEGDKNEMIGAINGG